MPIKSALSLMLLLVLSAVPLAAQDLGEDGDKATREAKESIEKLRKDLKETLKPLNKPRIRREAKADIECPAEAQVPGHKHLEDLPVVWQLRSVDRDAYECDDSCPDPESSYYLHITDMQGIHGRMGIAASYAELEPLMSALDISEPKDLELKTFEIGEEDPTFAFDLCSRQLKLKGHYHPPEREELDERLAQALSEMKAPDFSGVDRKTLARGFSWSFWPNLGGRLQFNRYWLEKIQERVSELSRAKGRELALSAVPESDPGAVALPLVVSEKRSYAPAEKRRLLRFLFSNPSDGSSPISRAEVVERQDPEFLRNSAAKDLARLVQSKESPDKTAPVLLEEADADSVKEAFQPAFDQGKLNARWLGAFLGRIRASGDGIGAEALSGDSDEEENAAELRFYEGAVQRTLRFKLEPGAKPIKIISRGSRELEYLKPIKKKWY